MPTGFGLKSGRYRSNAEVARTNREPIAKFTAWGRVNGYDAEYAKDVSLTALLKGPIEIYSIASVYRTPRGAHASFRDSGSRGTGYLKRRAVGAALGNEARLYTGTRRSNGFTIRVFAVYWRTGKLLGAIVAAGVEGGIDAETAVDLAKKQQARMRPLA